VVLLQKVGVFNWKMCSVNFLKLVIELHLQLVKSLHQLWLLKQIVFLIHHLLSQRNLTRSEYVIKYLNLVFVTLNVVNAF
jgi:hypothetical protein